jgi:hypothetical protein
MGPPIGHHMGVASRRAVETGITSPQYEQLTVTYHLSGSMRSFTNDP